MKPILFFLSTIFTLSICNAQTLPLPLPALQNGWERVNINDVGSIDMPDGDSK